MSGLIYEIRVKEQLDPRLASWFGDFAITHTPDGDTLLTGTVIDQAALYGVVARCRDLGLTLISILSAGEHVTTKGGHHESANS